MTVETKLCSISCRRSSSDQLCPKSHSFYVQIVAFDINILLHIQNWHGSGGGGNGCCVGDASFCCCSNRSSNVCSTSQLCVPAAIFFNTARAASTSSMGNTASQSHQFAAHQPHHHREGWVSSASGCWRAVTMEFFSLDHAVDQIQHHTTQSTAVTSSITDLLLINNVMYCMCTTLRGMSWCEINIHAPVACLSTPLLSSFSPNPHCHDHRHDDGAKVRRSSSLLDQSFCWLCRWSCC
jgi:hypothetical protein